MNMPLVGFIVKWLLTLALLIGCVRILDLKKIEHAITSIDFYAFVTAVTLALVGTIILPAIVTRKALFKNQIRVNQLELIVINLCMRFYTLVLPRVLSVAIRWKRYRAKGEAANVTALMVFERLVQILVYCLAALLFLALDHHHTDITRTSLWSLLGLVLATLTVLAIFLARGKGATTDNSWLETTGWLRQIIQRLWEAARAYRDLSYTELLYILSLSILTYLLFVTAAYIVASSMNLPVTWIQLAWMRTIIFLLTIFPLTIGGIGVRELGFVGLLSLYGVDGEEAFTLGLSLSAAQIVIGIIGALFEIRHWLGQEPTKIHNKYD